MKTPLSWISLYTPLDTLLAQNTPTELAHRYSIHTAEIDEIIPHTLDGVVVGKVLSCQRHPDSDKLRIVEVNIGNETSTILTGAANVDTAKYVPVATVGTVFPGNFEITPRKMAGMMSHGMICSDDELGLSPTRSEGIMILEDYWDTDILESKIGTPFFDLSLPFVGINGAKGEISLRDTTFEIDNKFITNRPDLFSIVGNAREWHTVFGIDMLANLPEKTIKITEQQTDKQVHIESEKCLAYNILETKQQAPKSSPLSVQIMMQRAGLLPKNTLVDITNLLLTEYGQPMHAFDAEKVQGDITVRMAHDGESIEALDDKTYTLTSSDLVIADESGPIAIAGVIGGKDSAVSDTTTHTLWESATFDSVSVRLTAQRLGIRTDASTRYEKSLDPLLAGKTFARVMEYLDFCQMNAEVIGQRNYLDESSLDTIIIAVQWDFIDKKIGIQIPHETMTSTLESLGFKIISQNDTGFEVQVPSWRATKDISIKEDIVEEIARVNGYEAVPRIPIPNCQPINEKNNQKLLKNTLLSFFSNSGWNEVLNYSFTNETLEKKCRNTIENAVGVQNAYTEDYTHMRTSLITRLIGNVTSNLRYSDDLRFFEIGNVYAKTGEIRPEIAQLIDKNTPLQYSERTMVAGIMTSENVQEVRENLESLFETVLGYTPLVHQRDDVLPFLHPGLSGIYETENIPVASFGRLHPKVLQNFDIDVPLVYFEIDFAELLALSLKREKLFQPISSYQALTRQLNFVLPEKVQTGTIARDILAVHPWVYDVYIDSIFRDETKIGTDLKSVNFTFTLQSMRQTISDDEVGEVFDKIIAMMSEKGYSLRG